MVDDDPWAWTNASPRAAPLSAQIRPAEASMPAPAAPDTSAQQMLTLATPSINGAIKGGYDAYKLATNPVGPLSAEQLGAGFAENMATQGVASTAAPLAAEAVVPIAGEIAAGTAIAPVASTIAAGTAAAGTGAAAGASTAAAVGSGALSGAGAGLAAMGPVGWAIGAGLLAKSLGIF